MSLESQHFCYLFIGKKAGDLTLLNELAFLQIVEIMRPLLALTDIRKGKINVSQYAERKRVKFARLRWTDEGFASVCQSVRLGHGEESFRYNRFSVEFPSLDSAYKRQETPEITLKIENDTIYGRVISEGDCGLFLSMREDVYEKAGQELMQRVLREIRALFDECRLLFRKRPWWMYESSQKNMGSTVSVSAKDEEGALQDVMPCRAIDKLYMKKYVNWTELDG
jgi:hypothetical protein